MILSVHVAKHHIITLGMDSKNRKRRDILGMFRALRKPKLRSVIGSIVAEIQKGGISQAFLLLLRPRLH